MVQRKAEREDCTDCCLLWLCIVNFSFDEFKFSSVCFLFQILPGVKVIIAHTETKGPLGDSHLGEVKL